MKITAQFAKKMSAYSLFAGAILAAEKSQAQIVYHDYVPDDTLFLPVDHWVDRYIDLNNDGQLDFNLSGQDYQIGVIGWRVWSAGLYGYVSTEAVMGYSGQFPNQEINNLQEGASVCPGGNNWCYFRAVGGADLLQVWDDGTVIGRFLPGATDQYIGVHFGVTFPTDTLYYGWMRVDVAPDASYFILKDYAYNSVPNACINAGETEQACDVPAGKFTDQITNNSAKVHWIADAEANRYKVRHKVTGTSTWLNISANNNYKKLKDLAANTQYDWQVKSICLGLDLGRSDWSEAQTFMTLPAKMSLEEIVSSFDVYPNPFSSATIISFSCEADSRVAITLYDLAGRKIQTLRDEMMAAGNHELNFNRSQLDAGIYFLQLKMNDEIITKKLVIE